MRQNIKLNSLHPVKIFMIGTKIKENEYFFRQASQAVINAQKENMGKEGPFKKETEQNAEYPEYNWWKGKRMVLLGGNWYFANVFEIA